MKIRSIPQWVVDAIIPRLMAEHDAFDHCVTREGIYLYKQMPDGGPGEKLFTWSEVKAFAIKEIKGK